MNGNRKRAKTAMVAFPVVSGSGSVDLYHQNNTFVDYPFLHRPPGFMPSGRKPRYATLPNNTKIVQEIYQRNTRTDSGIVKSTSSLFSLPPPPSLNPKLRFLKTLLSSKSTNSSNLKLRLAEDNQPMEKSRDSMIPTTPTLPPKLRTTKTQNTKTLTPQIRRKSSVTTKSRTEAGIQDNAFEVLLPSLKSCPVPGSKNTQGSQNDDNGAVFTEKQFRRSAEEREENPESLHLDKKGLKQFPLLGSDEGSLKLLSLQHNFICRLENLPSLSHLLVLDLYNNRVDRMTGLQVFHSLRVLLLGKNRIRRIEGLDGLKRLEILDLHGNQLRYIDNLTSLTSLRVLNLAGNSIRSIRNLGPYGLSALTELNLKRNRIKNLDGLHKAPHIRKLLLANNELQSLSALHPLRKMLFLQELLLEANPISSLPEYRSQILTLFPWITTLDKTLITDQMKLEAKAWHRRRIVEEDEIRKEHEKLRLTAASTREEVIHEARRRWESVKNFVKHTNNHENEIQDIENISDLNTSRQIEIPTKFHRVKSKTKSRDSTEDAKVLTRHGLPCTNPSISDSNTTDSIPFPIIIDNREFPSHSALPQPENESGSTIEGNIIETIIIISQSSEGQKISESDSKLPVIGTEEMSKLYIEKPVLIKRPMKVAVVRPLVRALHSELLVESLDEMSDRPPSRRECHGSSSQSCLAQVIRHDILNQLLTENQSQEVVHVPVFNNMVNIDPELSSPERNEPDKTPPILKSIMVNKTTEGNDVSNVIQVDNCVGTELVSSKDTISVIETVDKEFDLMPDIRDTPSLAKRPVFGRSNSTCILSAVPTSLATTNNSSSGSSSVTSSNINISGIKPNEVESVEKYLLDGGGSTRIRQVSLKTRVNALRSNSVDVQLPTSDSDSAFDAESVSTSVNATISGSEVGGRKPIRSIFPRRGRLKRGQTARTQSSALTTTSLRRPVTGVRDRHVGMSPLGSGRNLKRRGSATPLTTALESPTSNTAKKQGSDYLVEIDGRVLSLYGQGALKHMLTGFPATLISNVNTVKFHFISFDAIIPHFGKVRQAYPALEHVQFRATNITMLAQLNALADFQGLSSLQISKEGNPVVENEIWQHYAIYRLAHWGLQQINGKEIPSEYRGGAVQEECKVFESLGYLALSCLPQSALTPLAKKLHTLHCFCCCSPSTSSDESGKRKVDSNGDGESGGSNICTSWDDDPVLLDVIGKESLVYIPSKEESTKSKDISREVGGRIVTTGRDMIEKVDLLETIWASMMTEVVEDILIDYLCMDNYMKKELRKLKDIALVSNNRKSKF